MHRFLIGCVVAILFGTQNGFAQTAPAPARTIQTAVLLSEPRGDGALVITVPPPAWSSSCLAREAANGIRRGPSDQSRAWVGFIAW